MRLRIFPSFTKRNSANGGMSIIEVLVAVAILGAAMMLMTRGLKNAMSARSTIKDSEGFLAAEKLIRTALFQSTARFLEFDNCQDKRSKPLDRWSLTWRLSGYCSGPLQVTKFSNVLSASSGAIHKSYADVMPDTFKKAFLRCFGDSSVYRIGSTQTPVSGGPPNLDLSMEREFAICVGLKNSTVSTSGANQDFVSRNYVFAEARVQMWDLNDNSPNIPCRDYLRNSDNSLRQGRALRLYYTIYWYPKGGREGREITPRDFHQYSGLISGDTASAGSDPASTPSIITSGKCVDQQ